MIQQYLYNHRDTKFSWHKNNCLSFISGYLDYIGEEPLPEDWLKGYDKPKKAARHYIKTLETYSYYNIIDALDDRFYRELTLHPQDGYIVAKKSDDVMGHMLGLVCFDTCFFLTEKGLGSLEPEVTDIYWSITC